MDNRSGKEMEQDDDVDVDREEAKHRLLDNEGGDGDHDTFNPRTGEDPGLLPLTEDPLERRQKRNTM